MFESNGLLSLDTLAGPLPQRLLVIIDGNNYLFSQSPLYGDYREVGFPGEPHQQALISGVRQFLLQRPDLLVDLWFDGPEHRIDILDAHFRVIQSGGRGKDRADQGILRFLAERAKASPLTPCVLITRDKQLAKRGRKNSLAWGAWVLRS